MPQVSIIIPCYNSEKYLKKTIDSVFKQTFTNWEIIAIDDGSTDSTSDILKSYPDKIQILTQQNLGTQPARNLAIASSNSEYVAILDHDDIWLTDKLNQQVNYMDKNPDCGLCYTGSKTIDEKDQFCDNMVPFRPVNADGDAMPQLIRHNFMITSSVLLRREALEQAGEFNPRYAMAADWDM